MSSLCDASIKKGGLTCSSNSHHEPCILVQSYGSKTSSPCTPPSPKADSFKGRLSARNNEDEALEISSPSFAPSDTMLRLGAVSFLAVLMLIGGTLLFIKGFFLSRDDLPYISNGRDLPFPPLFPHLHPHSLHLKREEGVYYVSPKGQAPQSSGATETLHGGEELVKVNLESFLNPQLSSMVTKADTCDAVDCKTSWVSVTPYDRVVILLIDAMRFDFLLWDPDAVKTCKSKATLECEPAPQTLRPFYRNRLPFAHDLLRRSDAELKLFFSYLLGREVTKDTDDHGDGSPQAGVDSSGSDDAPTIDLNVTASRAQAPPAAEQWGGNRFTRLYLFEADTPTATTQRLTGLATGSMPSFFSVSLHRTLSGLVDSGASKKEGSSYAITTSSLCDRLWCSWMAPKVRETFSASPVTVDSILQQLKAARRTTVAIGDDTWQRSFGHLLTRTHAFPSLNIQDLHTVDNGVKAEMPKEFAQSDWSFLVGHALGVDHVGHGDVLDSEFMWKKLTEVNDMLKSTTKMILEEGDDITGATPSQTLFLFFGDHGMTEAGGHGGGSSEEVDAGLLSFSMLPASLSPRAAQELSPATRLFHSRVPTYLQNHGALSDIHGRRRVRSDGTSRSSSPTPTLGYGSRRIRQVGLAPTLSLLMGLPIPFNSMGQVIADLVPTLSGFVRECAQHLAEVSAASSTCDSSEGKPCVVNPGAAESIALTVRCSDLGYLTQLHHISAWQQYRAIKAHATITGNDAVLTDPRFAAAKVHWLNLYSALDKEIKALPPEAHIQLVQDVTYPSFQAANGEVDQTLPLRSAESNEEELLYKLRRHKAESASFTADGILGEDSAARAKDSQSAHFSSALPSLVPYLSAAAEFSHEAFLASIRQLGTFNMQVIWCGIFMTLSSLFVLLCAWFSLINSSESRMRETHQFHTESGLPDVTTFIWWLSISAGVGSVIWIAAWACCEAIKALQLSLSAAVDVIVWRQLPSLCLTVASCFLVFLFVKRTLERFSYKISLKTLSGLLQGEEEPLMEEHQCEGRFAGVLPKEICLSRLWLSLFGGGSLLCNLSLFALCLVPFNDCLVNRECAIVKFVTIVYCMSAGLATFGTQGGGIEKARIISAWAALILCIRLGSVFDLAENTSEGEGVARHALKIDTMSSAVLFMFFVFLVLGKEKLPLLSRAFVQKSNSAFEDTGSSRFRHLNFRPITKRGWRPSTRERIVHVVQGALVLVWFALPQDSKSQQSAGQESRRSQAFHSNLLHDWVAWLWGVAVVPFEAIDSVGSTWLAPLKQWMFSAPPSLLGVLPAPLKEGTQVNFLETLHIFLPWLVFATTGGLWLRLVLVLCRMEKRENSISTIQLRRIQAELTVTESELASCSQMSGRATLAHCSRSEGKFFHSWRIELWDYFAHYLLLTAMCPFCMYAMLLGRSQLWPLLLCCVKWRLLYFLSRVVVLPAPCAGEVHSGSSACECCFCRAKAAVMSCDATVSRPGERACSPANVRDLQGKKKLQFLLSDSSSCMLAGLLALDTFFVTGHRMKLSAVPVEAGFIGLLEFHPVWSVVTSFFHTYLIYMICCPFIFMIIFSRLAHLAFAAANPRSSVDEEELKTSTADTVVQKSLLKTAKIAFECVFSC
ncbi:hypothetical protein Esti_003177 [Eimeria stiedai]